MTNNVEIYKRVFADEVQRITNIFSEVLGIKNIASSDNFFKLGGDSFDAIRAISKLGNDLQLVTFFEHPTVEDLAKFILSGQGKTQLRLVPLYDNASACGSTVVIGVPFGGGDPTAYQDLFRRNHDVRVFGVDFGDIELVKESEFLLLINIIAAEIEKIDAKHLIIYGHCAGAATAACIASALEPIENHLSLIVAAAKPMDDPDAAIQEADATSDDSWEQFLRSIGAFSGLESAEIHAMLSRGRRDHRIAATAYRTLAKKPARGVPALVLLGDEDPVTPTSHHADIIEHWRRFIDVVDSKSLAGGDHYFLSTHPDEVADAVLSFEGHCLLRTPRS
ncbi:MULTISPECIES: alpha/beta fold hydrolase [unclassified Brenneria]|uniref:alpha/beta fold hydrolase n=1 Tax=unclassified Brenneria TaxID=2634434 RepID=UPI0015559B63|nr:MULTISPECIES: alpha/beta hydrolase [unclassified Brenneria]MEE3645145.1 alpha/beta fold hydrolase [Brenneria sp. L3_3C_1]MEE3652781.1 alpha/beta fold hydrolase [Brenneria sp. HEZEL_4_2_4]MBJ7223900.1 alpha/beta fold hydrolase [Brenneria sp. L3-3C-1]MEE3652804.1 alpha/beta fold hydrolase [Brenneria sp. HEZEL_4_2_4]NPD02736.1 alpha/beta fold hydrolase [Brenneria sp. hezel4-2-4]